MKKNRQVVAVCYLILVVVLFSCATNKGNYYAQTAGDISSGNYEKALTYVENNKDRWYKAKTDQVLYNLDTGLLNYYAENPEASNSKLMDAEKTIDENFTKSITRAAGAAIQDDNVLVYFGEDYENIYLNMFTALNFLKLNSFSEAGVEIRRADEKIKSLMNKYQVDMKRMQEEIKDKSVELKQIDTAKFAMSDSALYRYLHLLFSKADGRGDYKNDIRLDYDNLLLAFKEQKNLYYFPVPKFIDEIEEVKELKAKRLAEEQKSKGIKSETIVPTVTKNENEAEVKKYWLNFLVFTGQSPYKVDGSQQLNLPVLGINTKLALPKLVTVPSKVSSIKIDFGNNQNIELELIEDMSRVAEQTFNIKYNSLYNRAMIRAVLKTTLQAAGTAAQTVDTGDEKVNFLTKALGMITNIGAKVSSNLEQADLRISRFFPGQAYIGGIKLPAGNHPFTVSYKDASGTVLYETRHNQAVDEKTRLNLFTTQWLN